MIERLAGRRSSLTAHEADRERIRYVYEEGGNQGRGLEGDGDKAGAPQR
jgi:hypothetical protein